MSFTESPKRGGGRPHFDPEKNVHQELLDAAERCLEQAAAGDVGLRHIAREAGVTTAMINYYFGGKHGLFVALYEALERTFSNSVRELELQLSSSSYPPIDRLINVQIEFYARHQGLLKLIRLELQESAESALTPDTPVHSSIVYDSVVSLLLRMMKLGLIRKDVNASYAASIIVCICCHPFVMGAVFEKSTGIQLSDIKDGQWATYAARMVEEHLGLLSQKPGDAQLHNL